MNVSVLRTNVCLLYYLCLSDEIRFIFCCFVPLFSTQVWRLEIVCKVL